MSVSVTAHVTVRSSIDESEISKEYTISKEDIDDIAWKGGNSGDRYFDDMDTDEERFTARLEDVSNGFLYDDADQHLGAEGAEHACYHEHLRFSYEFNNCSMVDFIND